MSTHWLARLSGAHLGLLEASPNDTVKHTAMGGVMLTTAGVATGSAAFALHSALASPVWAAISLGLAWGVVVLNLDRALLVSMSRSRGWLVTLFTALPRVALAALIGTVISVPLVLQIFAPEIGNELRLMTSENQQAAQTRLDTQYADIPQLQARIQQLQSTAAGVTGPQLSDDPAVRQARATVDDDQRQFTDADKAVICENQGGNCPGGSGQPGEGGLYRDKVARRDGLQAKLQQDEQLLAQVQAKAEPGVQAEAGAAQASARTELTHTQGELASRESARQADEAAARQAAQDSGGLLERLEALDRLTSDDASLAAARWALFGLFMSLELLPVLVKILAMCGPPTTYDRLLDARQRQTETSAMTAIKNDQKAADDRADAEARRRRDDIAADEAVARHQRDDLTQRLKKVAVSTNESYARTLLDLTERLQRAWQAAATAKVDGQLRQYRAQREPASTPAAASDGTNGSSGRHHRPEPSATPENHAGHSGAASSGLDIYAAPTTTGRRPGSASRASGTAGPSRQP